MKALFLFNIVTVCLCYETVVLNEIKSCNATFEQDRFPCAHSIDGNKGPSNGWAVKGSEFPQKPQNVTFTFDEVSDLDFMNISCTFDNKTHIITSFSILVGKICHWRQKNIFSVLV